MNDDREISDIIDKYQTLSKKLNRYWPILLRKGLRVAKERGLEIIATNEVARLSDEKIAIRYNEDNINAEKVIALAKDHWFGIYQTYKNMREQHRELETQLVDIRNQLNEI